MDALARHKKKLLWTLLSITSSVLLLWAGLRWFGDGALSSTLDAVDKLDDSPKRLALITLCSLVVLALRAARLSWVIGDLDFHLHSRCARHTTR